mmetsp:Transcript_61167/g.158754  ORF Transcript_61167/g.158754 Transcript_61167/m.158754 type:complete len:227 (+) Transcript_61167:505-1185(+)
MTSGSPPKTARQSAASPAGSERSFEMALSCCFGTPRCVVPVSRTPWQPPSPSHAPSLWPPTCTARICTCQCPISGLAAGTQLSGPVARWALCPPMAISLSEPFADMNTPKWGRSSCPLLASTSKKLKLGETAKGARPRPRMPSNPKLSNGCLDMSTAITPWTRAQGPSFWRPPPGAAAPRHTLSWKNSPTTLPVPKPMVTWSDRLPSGTVLPSRFTAEPEGEADTL